MPGTGHMIAWAAGFLDGEGYFTARFSDARQRSVHVRIGADQIDRRPLDALQRMFGGTIRARARRNPKHNDTFQWELNGVVAVTFAAETLRPYLLVKAEAADALLAVCELVKPHVRGENVSRFPPAVVAQRAERIASLSSINRRGA